MNGMHELLYIIYHIGVSWNRAAVITLSAIICNMGKQVYIHMQCGSLAISIFKSKTHRTYEKI